MPTDDFSGSGALGGDWTVTAGAFTQSGGSCYGDANSTSSFAIYTTGSVSTDHKSGVVLQPRGSGQFFGVVVRGNTSDSACANVDAAADGLYVSTWDAGGSQTVLPGFPITCPAAGTLIELEAVGTTLRLLFDGVEQWSGTPAGLPVSGRYGICAYSTGTTTGASSWTGADVASGFDLAPTSGIAFHGALTAAGDVSAPSPVVVDIDPTSGVALLGVAAVAGDVNAGAPVVVDVVPTSGITVAGRLAATGNVSVRSPWEFEPPLQVRQMAGVLQVAGDIGFTIPFDVVPLGAVALHGAPAVTGDVEVSFSGPFDVAPLSTISLHGLLAVTGDVRAGSPFDLAAGGITLHGATAVAGDVASNSAPPAPPPPSVTDPLDPKLVARRKRPNIRMRWGSGEPPTAQPAPEPAPIEPAPEPPRLARGLDLGLLPEPPAPPAPAAPTPKDAPPAVPAAPVAPPAAPTTPVVPPVVLPPDLTAEVAALRAAHASLRQEMQQAAARAVQRAADVYTALQQQTAHLERELAQARSEITSLRTKVERDARNRRRAEEIARKLLDDK